MTQWISFLIHCRLISKDFKQLFINIKGFVKIIEQLLPFLFWFPLI